METIVHRYEGTRQVTPEPASVKQWPRTGATREVVVNSDGTRTITWTFEVRD